MKNSMQEKARVSNRSTGRRILFVDDDEDDKFLFDRVMKKIDDRFDIHYATNGDQMFSILEHITPDLIFLDLHMPGKSGITCLRMLRHLHKYDAVPIIIYTVMDKKAFIEDCFMAKANHYIIKPVTEEKIMLAMQKVMNLNWDVAEVPIFENFLI